MKKLLITAFIAHLLGSILGSVLFTLSALVFQQTELRSFSDLIAATLITAISAFVFSSPFVYLLGIWIYDALYKRININFLTCVLCGSMPGLIIFAFSRDFIGGIAITCGASIAAAFHWLYNDSLTPHSTRPLIARFTR